MKTYFLLFCILAFFSTALAAENALRAVKLEWGAVDGATAYDLELRPTGKNADDKKSLKKRVKEPQWIGKVASGSYDMRIRSVDDRGVPGEWSEAAKLAVQLPATEIIEPKHKAQVQTDELENAKIRLRWKEIAGAKSYKVEWSSENQKTKGSETVSDASLKVNLPVANGYQWQVTPIDADGQAGETMAQPGFFVLFGKPLETPKVDEPENKYVQKITWHNVEKAQFYSYLLMKKDPQNKWRLIEKNDKATTPSMAFKAKYRGGAYKLMVRAHGSFRKASEYTQAEFEVHDGDRTPAAVEQAILRESIEKPSSFYGIASYLVTMINYQSLAYQDNLRSQFDALGGTGRLGLGYKPQSSNFGVFAILDAGGFNFRDKNYTFTSSEVHATYNFPLKVSVAQISTGLFQKTLPLLVYHSDTQAIDLSGTANTGLHTGAKFWHPFTTKLGASLHTQGYYAVSGSSPYGTKIIPTFSYELGLLGSYRLSPRAMGFAGVTQRTDKTSIEASQKDRKGQLYNPTTITLQGTYVNLILEYSF